MFRLFVLSDILNVSRLSKNWFMFLEIDSVTSVSSWTSVLWTLSRTVCTVIRVAEYVFNFVAFPPDMVTALLALYAVSCVVTSCVKRVQLSRLLSEKGDRVQSPNYFNEENVNYG